jgi:hypothetical protein
MTINLMSASQVKTELGITATTYDTSIASLLPIVSTDVRRILNARFDRYILCRFDATSTELKSSWDIDIHGKRREDFTFELGTVVTHNYLPDDTYISEYDAVNHIYTLSATPTGTGDHCYPTIKISQWRAIAKMIWYRIGEWSTDMPDRIVMQKSMGPLSVTFKGSVINQRWDYPQELIDDLGVPFQRIG